MQLKVDLSELHAVASRFTPPFHATPEGAFAAGADSIVRGANPENCHFSFMATPELLAAWEEGRAHGRQQTQAFVEGAAQ